MTSWEFAGDRRGEYELIFRRNMISQEELSPFGYGLTMAGTLFPGVSGRALRAGDDAIGSGNATVLHRTILWNAVPG